MRGCLVNFLNMVKGLWQKMGSIGRAFARFLRLPRQREASRLSLHDRHSSFLFTRRKSPRLGALRLRRSFFSSAPLIPAHNRLGLLALDFALAAAVVGALVFFAYAVTAPDARVSATLRVDGGAYALRVRPSTVDALLTSLGITLGASDRVTPAPDEMLRDGDEINIERAFPVAVLSGGETKVLHMRGGTVGDALEQAGVRYDADDELSHLAFADVSPGMQIQHTDVTTRYESRYKTLDYEEQIIQDPSRYTEYREVETRGKNGVKLVTQRIVSKNGMVVSREIVDQLVISPAVNEIIRVGTKVRYQTSFTGETRLYKPAPKAGADGWVEMTVYRCTAYTGGGRTATGTRPKLGTISVNPKIIPFGSQIYVKGYGYGVAEDTGAFRNYPAPRDNAIDLYFNTEKECARWGTKYNLKILVKLK